MHFGLTEEQIELAGTVASLIRKRADSQAVRAAAGSEQGFDTELWQTLCEQIGVAALAVPEQYDGAGFTPFETGVVLEQLGYGLVPAPLLPALVATEALLGSGNDDVCARLLPRIAAGEVATLVWPEVTGSHPAGPWLEDPHEAGLRLENDGTLTGSLGEVLFGAQADLVLVAARTAEPADADPTSTGASATADSNPADPGTALVEVDPGQLQIMPQVGMDLTWQYASVTADRAPCTVVARDATDALARARRTGVAAVGWLQLGTAQRGLDMTVAYTQEREQFGRPVGSFQALKHRMADMLVQVETTRSVVWAAAYSAAVGPGGSLAEVEHIDSPEEHIDSPEGTERTRSAADAEHTDTLLASAASHAAEALDLVASETVQLHGGIAITWEHDAQLLFKRAHALGQLFGQAHQHRTRLPL